MKGLEKILVNEKKTDSLNNFEIDINDFEKYSSILDPENALFHRENLLNLDIKNKVTLYRKMKC